MVLFHLQSQVPLGYTYEMTGTHKPEVPLLAWMKRNGLEGKYEEVARGIKISPRPCAESVRLFAHAYRDAGGDMCFAVEEYTRRVNAGDFVSARDLRNQTRRRRKKAA